MVQVEDAIRTYPTKQSKTYIILYVLHSTGSAWLNAPSPASRDTDTECGGSDIALEVQDLLRTGPGTRRMFSTRAAGQGPDVFTKPLSLRHETFLLQWLCLFAWSLSVPPPPRRVSS